MDLQIENPNRRVNVISIEIRNTKDEVVQQSGIIMRTTRSYAAKLLAAGTHTITSKGKLKSYLNKSGKLHRNARFLKRFDLTAKKSPHKMMNDNFNDRSYVLFFRKNRKVDMVKRHEINPLTGLPMTYSIEVPMYQRLVASYTLAN